MVRLVLALPASSAVIASVNTGAGDAARAHSLCGAYRWAVKTLQDRPTLLPTRMTTIRFLVTRLAPRSLLSRRLPFERHVYRITARVVLFRSEDDGDIHVVPRDAHGNHMITETPSPACTGRATLRQHVQMLNARRAVERCERPEGAPPVLARVTGVAFFDTKHGQSGVAPNGIELHPILGFRSSASRSLAVRHDESGEGGPRRRAVEGSPPDRAGRERAAAPEGLLDEAIASPRR